MPVKILMPALSPTMTEGKLAKWLIGEGDSVNSGDIIAEIETDKATMEVEAVEEGKLGKIVVPEGSEGVPVNNVIALLLEEGEDGSSLEGVDVGETPISGNGSTLTAATSEPAVAPVLKPTPSSTQVPAETLADRPDKRIIASPLARRMASQAGIGLDGLTGSGPNGRIVKVDVEAAITADISTPVSALAQTRASITESTPYEPEFELETLSTMRKTIARRLTESKQNVPHFYLTVDCEIDDLLRLRKTLNEKANGTYKLSVNDLVIKSAAIALRRVPKANASWTEDGLKFFKSVDISVAVAIEGGLITPVVRQADNKGLETISAEMRELSERARDGKLGPEEYQGGTFSISNLGMYGIKDFAAVINPPQACILAVGVGEQRPVVKDGALAVATVMSCTLSVDHRAVDGAIGAEYLGAFKRLIEDPLNMLL